ncbi:MAG TPA: phytanoyl-CoA dioxygenase family protein [Terriglobales bacterium]|nr:phytanoyl-CoA dioxygenase family protein [Terriglobales bacterium]
MIDLIHSDPGYSTELALTPAELARVTELIRSQWSAHLHHHYPELSHEIERCTLADYHRLAPRLDHATLWPKSARILSAAAVAEIRTMSLVRRLEAIFGKFEITAEERCGHEEIYWRLVRPNQPADVGPLHADAWFWELGHGRIPPERERIKVWVAVITESGRNGLRVVPGSHRRQWRYHGEQRDGMLKPCLDEREEDLDLRLLPAEPGQAVIFHDRLLHGGALNLGEHTRVSFEMTLTPASKGAAAKGWEISDQTSSSRGTVT